MRPAWGTGPPLLPSRTLADLQHCPPPPPPPLPLPAAGFADSSVRLFDVDQLGASSSSGQVDPQDSTEPSSSGSSSIHVLYGHTAPVYGVDMSTDGRLLLSSSADGTVRLWSSSMHANLVGGRVCVGGGEGGGGGLCGAAACMPTWWDVWGGCPSGQNNVSLGPFSHPCPLNPPQLSP